MLFTFLLGFISAFVVLGALIVAGGKKGHEFIQTRLGQLKDELAERQKKEKVADSANWPKLDPVKHTATVSMKIKQSDAKTHKIKAKLFLLGSKLKVHQIDEKTKDGKKDEDGTMQDKPIAVLNVKEVSCTMEDTKDPPPRELHFRALDPTKGPLFRDDREGQADWLLADMRFETVRECERFYNIIEATDRTLAWKSHVKNLPSVDVFNVFLSRILFELNSGPELEQKISEKITKKLNAVKLPIPGKLTLNALSVGKAIPFIDGVSFISYNASSGEFSFDFNLKYGGGFSLQLCAQLHLRNVALPPVIIDVKVDNLEGNVHLSVGAPPSNKAWIGFYDAPNIHLSIKQEVQTGREGGLLSHIFKAVPDLSDVITNLVKVKLFEDMIFPNMDDVPLPDFKDTPPSTPVDKPHQTTFGTTPVPDHPKPAGYPGATTTATIASSTSAAGGSAAAAADSTSGGASTNSKQDSAAANTATAESEKKPAATPAAPSATTGMDRTGSTDMGSKEKSNDNSLNNFVMVDGEKSGAASKNNSVQSFSASSTSNIAVANATTTPTKASGKDGEKGGEEDLSVTPAEKRQLQEMEERAAKRNDSMKEAVKDSTKKPATPPAVEPSKEKEEAANSTPPSSSAAAAAYPAGYPSAYPASAPNRPRSTSDAPATTNATTSSSSANNRDLPAGYPSAYPAGSIGGGGSSSGGSNTTAGGGAPEKKADGTYQQPAYTYNAQPQWSSQPQWGGDKKK